MTGERQATRIRSLYLKSVLRQEIAFFDVGMTTGQIVSRMTGDTVLVQDAIGEKVTNNPSLWNCHAQKQILLLIITNLHQLTLQVGKFQQLVATFVAGFVISFVKGWLLSLVMLASIPPVVLAGAIVSKRLAKISTKGQDSYSDAGDIVEQTLGAIKTVSSKALLSYIFNLACPHCGFFLLYLHL